MGEVRFRVDVTVREPRPSWTAWRLWEPGVLTVLDGRAEFVGSRGSHLLIADVTEVNQPSRRQLYRQHDLSWMTNTWIRVSYVSTGERLTLFINERRFTRLGHYLRHKRLRRALDALIVCERTG